MTCLAEDPAFDAASPTLAGRPGWNGGVSSIPYDRPEELLARTGWMRALATRLLADPAAADDVVQEAWLAALEHPPRANAEAWLGRVVRNLAWKRRRGEGRRAEHERALPAAEPHPGPEATAERLELQRRVLDAVAAIDEPFRTAVVERYLQGRTSADIARALGVPEGTVRWRLKRGLAELRARLDDRFGGREAWSALLLPLALPPMTTGGAAPGSPLAPPVLEPGILAMLGVSKIALASVVGAAALGFILWRPGDESRGARPAAELEETAALERAPERELASPSEAPSEQRVAHAAAQEAAEPSRPAATEAVAEASAPHALLALRFIDAQGAPWQGVEVGEHWGSEVRDRSDADGRAELRFEPESGHSEWIVVLSARRAGCATRQMRVTVTAGRTTDLGDVVLEPGVRIEGRVLDEVGGVIAEAEVGPGAVELFGDGRARRDEAYVRRQGSAGFDLTLATTSAADGSFVLEGVSPGTMRLWAHSTGARFGWGWTEPFEVRAGEDLFGMDVRLPGLLATDTISGIVLDPLGKPLPSAQLLYTYEIERESGTTTKNLDEDGRFQIVIQRETNYSFVASDPEGRYAPAYAYDVAPGTQGLDLRLAEKRTFAASVRDRDGRAVPGCRFALSVHVGGGVSRDEPTPALVEPGLYDLPLPSVAFDLEVEADGFLPARFEELRPETVGARFEVTLDTAPRLKGRVVADGRPVAGARVTLHRSFEGRGYWRDEFACVYDAASEREVACDERGRFELTCRSQERVWLRASSAGYAIGELGPLDPLTAGELTLELTVGGSLEGRVLLPDGADATGVLVGINHGDGHPRTLRAGPEGRFRFDALAPGPWQVLRQDAEIDPSSTTTMSTDEPHEIEWSCTVEAGRTTRYDLDLSRP